MVKRSTKIVFLQVAHPCCKRFMRNLVVLAMPFEYMIEDRTCGLLIGLYQSIVTRPYKFHVIDICNSQWIRHESILEIILIVFRIG